MTIMNEIERDHIIKVDGKINLTLQSKYNVTNNYIIPYQMHYHIQNNSNQQVSYFH